MKKIIMALILMLATSLAFVSCEKNDDDETMTFLEKYEGTFWAEVDDNKQYLEEVEYFLRVIDNIDAPFERYLYASYSECYHHYPIEMKDESWGNKITKNTENTFGYRRSGFDGAEYATETVITINGSSLTMYEEFSMDGVVTDSETTNYTKSTTDVLDSLVLCGND